MRPRGEMHVANTLIATRPAPQSDKQRTTRRSISAVHGHHWREAVTILISATDTLSFIISAAHKQYTRRKRVGYIDKAMPPANVGRALWIFIFVGPSLLIFSRRRCFLEITSLYSMRHIIDFAWCHASLTCFYYSFDSVAYRNDILILNSFLFSFSVIFLKGIYFALFQALHQWAMPASHLR